MNFCFKVNIKFLRDFSSNLEQLCIGERGSLDFPSFLAFRAQIFGSKELCSIGLANVS